MQQLVSQDSTGPPGALGHTRTLLDPWSIYDMSIYDMPRSNYLATGPLCTTLVASVAEEKKVEAKKEESEESDDDMGFGLFD
ncbi:hypothetical protein A6R68_20230 [Neotoma lepida]|uniref:Uncharacterized protein n=1 Tax=Neotoma lepida TaxID=56216 RepID=A0A1A6HUS9_NEOLE|nr:hypothetical protein A6R68_20230 [Neotoma lepida]